MSCCNPLYQCPPLPYREGQNRRFYPLKEWVRGYKEDPERRRFSLFALCSMLFFTSAHYSGRVISRCSLAVRWCVSLGSLLLRLYYSVPEKRLSLLSTRLFLACSRGDFSLFARCSLALLDRFSTCSCAEREESRRQGVAFCYTPFHREK